MVRFALSPLRIRFSLLAWIFIGLVIAVISLDQVSKVHAERNLKVWAHDTDLTLYQGRRVPLCAAGDAALMGESEKSISSEPAPKPGHVYISLNLNYVRNQGAAHKLAKSEHMLTAARCENAGPHVTVGAEKRVDGHLNQQREERFVTVLGGGCSQRRQRDARKRPVV